MTERNRPCFCQRMSEHLYDSVLDAYESILSHDLFMIYIQSEMR